MLLLDLLGHGYSDHPPDWSYSIEDHAATVAALLDYLGLRGCAVLGHSMGGPIGIALAAARSALVSRLILAEGVPNPGVGGMAHTMAAYTEEEFCRTGAQSMIAQNRALALAGSVEWASVLASSQRSDFRAVHRTVVSFMQDRHPTLRERLKALRIPRANIYGARTLQEQGPASRAEDLRAAGISILVVPDAGHVMMADNLQGFAEAIVAALHLD
jgi:pimeloyl-ACP methyl ester carboxylesterase